MKDEPNIVQVAAAIGEAARARMLGALMGGQALTATELADVAGVTRQTASVHLGKLLEAGLLSQVAQGRHRYFRIANEEIARLMESMMGLASRVPLPALGPRDVALRKARVCYDHLAGDLGVMVFDGLLARGVVRQLEDGVVLGNDAATFFQNMGVVLPALTSSKRPMCLACLDWSVRRSHLAGVMGAVFLQRCFELSWCRKDADSRVLHFSAEGERELHRLFDVAE